MLWRHYWGGSAQCTKGLAVKSIEGGLFFFVLGVWDGKHFVALAGLAGVVAGPGGDGKGPAAVTALRVFTRPCANVTRGRHGCRGDSASRHGTAVM